MIVSFLAGSQRHPVGGVTSRYEYANAMRRRGHDVHLAHFTWLRPSITSLEEVDWFRFEPGIEHHFDAPGAPLALPDADFITDDRFPRRHGLPFLFFQGTQPFTPEKLTSIYRARAPKVCVARWLVEEALAHGVPAHQLVHIPHGIDHERFRSVTPLDERAPRVAMLHHRSAIKGTSFGLAALEAAKAQVPEMEVVLFGARAPTEALPAWMTFVQAPEPEVLVRDVYNASRVFVSPGLLEGFGKTSVEAMACGCALVSTANGGSGDFAFHDETALVSEPRAVDAMADHVVALLRDDDRRRRLARAGRAYVARFDWDESARRLEEFLERYHADPDRFTDPGATPP